MKPRYGIARTGRVLAVSAISVAMISASTAPVDAAEAVDGSGPSASRITKGSSAYLKTSGPFSTATVFAYSKYRHKRERVRLENWYAKRRKPVFVFKLRKRASWQSGKRCWLKRAPGKKRWCSVKKYKGHNIRPNKWIYWRLCRGLPAPRKKDQIIRWRKRTHCTTPQKFRQ